MKLRERHLMYFMVLLILKRQSVERKAVLMNPITGRCMTVIRQTKMAVFPHLTAIVH